MTATLSWLAWTLALALIQILIAATYRRWQEDVLATVGWSDETPPHMIGVAGRMRRAQDNLFETLPIIAAAFVIAHVTGRESSLTEGAAILYFWTRLAYAFAFAVSKPMLRTVLWGFSLVAVLMSLSALVTG